MTLVIDAAPLVALADPDEPQRQAILEVIQSEPGALIVPAPVTAEIDYLLGQRFGHAAQAAFLRDLAAGRYTAACVEREDYTAICDLDARYADLQLGLADCALVVLASRYKTTRVVSFGGRHLRTVTPLWGEAFTILPADR
jgi:uncharacterized protein